MKTEVIYIEAVSDLETLKERNSDVNQTLELKKNEVVSAVRNFTAASEEYNKARREAESLIQQSREDAGLAEVMDTIKDYTIDQLEADIDSDRARLELSHEGSGRIIREFEDRQRQIDKLKSQLSDLQAQLDDVAHSMNELRNKWEPKLDEIVKRINDAFADSFAQIGCAGQVSVDKNENDADEHSNLSRGIGEQGNNDFDQWSIRIQVKFREHESLSVLDSHRQSGGERAVSTIFYLMALQSLSTSPFRVVDEINQGMDPRNERMVHGRMVDIACSSDANKGGQYFLITPKLLTGLSYKPGMKVLCIVSGEYMPEDYGKVDFRRCVQRKKEVLQKRGKARALSPVQISDSSVEAAA